MPPRKAKNKKTGAGAAARVASASASASTRTSTSPNARLDRLPAELYLLILRHLSKRDCANLALVCKSLQDVGESVVWRRVSLALGKSWDEEFLEQLDFGDDLAAVRTRAKDQPEDAVARRKERSHWVPSSPLASWEDHCARMTDRVTKVEEAFNSRPERARHVRRLVFEPSPRLMARSKKIVAAVWGNLEHLEVESFGVLAAGKTSAMACIKKMYDMFANMGIVNMCLSLRTLDVKLVGDHSQIDDQLATILHIAPGLTTLNLQAPTEWTVPPNHLLSEKWKTLTRFHHLESITWCRNYSQLAVYVNNLVKRSPELTTFKIENQLNVPDLPFPAVVKELAQAKGLRRLVWDNRDDLSPRNHPLRKGAFKHLEELIRMDDLPFEEYTMIEFVEIPPFRALRSILLAVRSSEWALCEPLPHPVTDGAIHPQIVERLLEAPRLELVQFGIKNQARLDPDVSSWCDKRINGVLIRSYGHGHAGYADGDDDGEDDGPGPSPSSADQDRLIHIRRLELLRNEAIPMLYMAEHEDMELDDELYTAGDEDVRPGEMCRYDLCTRHGSASATRIASRCRYHKWVDSTDFRGRPVPPEVLRRFYAAIGDDPEWFTPARNTEPVPPNAMAILTKWRNSVDDTPWYHDEDVPDLETMRETARAEAAEMKRDMELEDEMEQHGFAMSWGEDGFDDESEDDGDGNAGEDNYHDEELFLQATAVRR